MTMWFSNGIIVGNIMKYDLVRGEGVCTTEIVGRTVSKAFRPPPNWPASFIRGMEVTEPYILPV